MGSKSWLVLISCCLPSLDNRPSFPQVVERLDAMMDPNVRYIHSIHFNNYIDSFSLSLKLQTHWWSSKLFTEYSYPLQNSSFWWPWEAIKPVVINLASLCQLKTPFTILTSKTNSDGTYSSILVVLRPEKFALSVRLNGVDIFGSPFLISPKGWARILWFVEFCFRGYSLQEFYNTANFMRKVPNASWFQIHFL